MASRSDTRTRPIPPAYAVAFGVALSALLVIALFPLFPKQFNVRVGDIASRTVTSTRDVSFESASLTDQKRDEAAAAVPPSLVFAPDVRAGQLQAYDGNATQIGRIRTQSTDLERKRDQLSASLSQRSIDTVLTMPDERWQAVVEEGRRVLTQQLSVSLDESSVQGARDSVDALIGVDYSADEALLTAELVRPLITTTLVEDVSRTEAAREAARSGVAPERVNITKGDVILTVNQPVDDLTIEKLRAAKLVSQRVEWPNVAAALLVAIVGAGIVAGYLFIVQPKAIHSERHLIVLALVTAAPVLIAKLYLPLVMPDDDRMFLPYILPLAAAPLLVAALLETDVAVVVSAVTGALVAFISTFLPDLSLVASIGVLDAFRLLGVYALAPVAGIFLVHHADRLNRYLTAGVGVAATSYALLMATWLVDNDRVAEELGWMALASGVGGLSAGVIAAGAFVTAGALFGVTTRLQLMELSQLNAPLLRKLQDEAPGTFHHSIIVGNLAERAADLIGADALLTRVGCYYHDIGKTLQPGMYIENQLSGETPHDDMTPEESSAIIMRHVTGGQELAARARLPTRVQAFIPEHHGTRLVAYFYRKAAEKDPEVDTGVYTYPGPKPQSKETAIVMLADSCEATVRSAADRSPERISEMVEAVIAERLQEGQLDDSDLTLRDLRTTAESFKATFRAVYHPRVQYPAPSAAEVRRRVLRLPSMRPPNAAAAPPEKRRPERRKRKWQE
ncbi:MAG: HDIG domain-containing protein [Chloroflexi bacterium]|nr:HDIG domain-containing protein [Chloroflexota bacterium]